MTAVWRLCTFFTLLGAVNAASIVGLPDSALTPSDEAMQCRELWDDCSVPNILNQISGNLKKYYNVFDPACLKHDICYRCGRYNGWEQHSCDKKFRKNMIAICHQRYTTKRTSYLKKARIAGELGYGMLTWLNIPPGTLAHCLHGASMFYKAVDGFGDGSYGKVDYEEACKKPCARLGKPELAKEDYHQRIL